MAKKARRVPRYQRVAKAEQAARIVARGTAVNRQALAPSYSGYSEPTFVTRGVYTDQPFECSDCGKAEIWTAVQQKWWYEVAKGDVFTIASRCRACRRKERERRAEARRLHLEGIARKQQERPPNRCT